MLSEMAVTRALSTVINSASCRQLMQTEKHNAQVTAITSAWKKRDEKIAFIPTMGNLHEGHLQLVKTAREQAERIVVSVYVNPLQFGQDEDFADYPRTLEQDKQKLSALDVDLLFTPGEKDIYPQGMNKATFVEVPELSNILCGEFRPVHFRGVTTIVNKLFNIVQPDIAVFGKKDYQQFIIIRRMVDDTGLPVRIIGVETRRETSGLAMSSRNQYLAPEDKDKAALLYQYLKESRKDLMSGNRDFEKIQLSMARKLKQAGFKIDYISIRDADDLSIPDENTANCVMLVAAWLGKTRLIDNVTCALK